MEKKNYVCRECSIPCYFNKSKIAPSDCPVPTGKKARWKVGTKTNDAKPTLKYEPANPMSLEKLWEAQPDKTCQQFLADWADFTMRVLKIQGRKLFGWDHEFATTAAAILNQSGPFKDLPTRYYDYMVRYGFLREARPDLKVDDRVLVSDLVDDKHLARRHFAEWSESGRIVCWGGGKTSWSASREI